MTYGAGMGKNQDICREGVLLEGDMRDGEDGLDRRRDYDQKWQEREFHLVIWRAGRMGELSGSAGGAVPCSVAWTSWFMSIHNMPRTVACMSIYHTQKLRLQR